MSVGAPAPATTPVSAAPAEPAAVPAPAAPVATKPAEAPPAEAAKPATILGKPAETEAPALKLPEGLKADHPGVVKLLEAAKAKGFNTEQTQWLLDSSVEAQKLAVEQRQKEQSAWVAELRADKEIGGTNFEASAKLAQRAFAKFATPEDAAWLEETGLGNNPRLVRMFVRMGKAMAEDSVAGTQGPGGTPPPSKEQQLRAMYPNSPGMFSKSS